MKLDHCHRASCVQIIDQLRTTITEKDERIAELETYLKSETKDKNSAQESFGTAWSEWQRCEKRIAQLEEVLRLALANLNWCEQAIADLRPQPYPLTLKDARDAINKINEVIG